MEDRRFAVNIERNDEKRNTMDLSKDIASSSSVNWDRMSDNITLNSNAGNKENIHFLATPEKVTEQTGNGRCSKADMDVERLDEDEKLDMALKEAEKVDVQKASDLKDYMLKKKIQAKFDNYQKEEQNFALKFWQDNYYNKEKIVDDVVIQFASFSDMRREPVKKYFSFEKKSMTKAEAQKLYPHIDFSDVKSKEKPVNSEKSLQGSATSDVTDGDKQTVSVKTESTDSNVQLPNSSKRSRRALNVVSIDEPTVSAENTTTLEPIIPTVPSDSSQSNEIPIKVDPQAQDVEMTDENAGRRGENSQQTQVDTGEISHQIGLESQSASSSGIENTGVAKVTRSKREVAGAKESQQKPDDSKSSEDSKPEEVFVFSTLQEWGNIYGESVTGEEIAAVKLKPLIERPPFFMFRRTAANIRVPDSTELQNCPYLGDDLDARDKKFLDDLIYNFEGKLRAWGEIEDIPPHLFVEVTQMVWESMGYDLKDPNINIRDPPVSVIKKLGSMFSSDDYIKLRERYINFSSDKSEMKKLKDISDKTEVLTRKQSISRMRKFFCRRCYRYDCEMHDSVPLPPPDKFVSDLQKNNWKRCGPNCYMHYHKCLYVIQSAELGKAWLKDTSDVTSTSTNWSPYEQSCLNLVREGHAKNICNLSNAFVNRTCFEVFLQLLSDGYLAQLKYLDNSPPVFKMNCSESVLRYECAPNVWIQRKDQLLSDGYLAQLKYLDNSPPVFKMNCSESVLRYECAPNVWIQRKVQMEYIYKIMTKQQSLPRMPYYQTCQHEEPEDGRPVLCGTTSESCVCVNKNSFCDKACNCHPDCLHRFPGCSCKGSCSSKATCLCLMAGRECDPDLCTNCCVDGLDDKNSLPILHPVRDDVPEVLDNDKTFMKSARMEYLSKAGFRYCENNHMQRPLHNSKIMLGVSSVAGWGLFATFPIRPGEFIGEYRGEVVSQNEAERRGKMYDRNFNSYLFNLNSEFVVDATNIGSKMRFINHSAKKANCTARVVYVCGDHKIGVYALKNIRPGQELFYNYRYSGRKGVNGRKDDSASEDSSCADDSDSSSESEEEEEYEEEGAGNVGRNFDVSGSEDELEFGEFTYKY